MLLTITTTHQPATDIGFLLHKNPSNLHKISLPFGDAYVFYPEATDLKCTAALVLEIDPIGLVRKDKANDKFALYQYVNDRPYVASSFMSVAIANAFGTLLSGRSKHRQELVEQAIPLEIKISVLPCRGGKEILYKLFEPLGYELDVVDIPLDEKFPEWGNSPYYSVAIHKTCSLREFLLHLYVLIPVLDNEKHYWINDDEVKKLLRYGESWLKFHPEKEFITRRYLKNFKSLVSKAIEHLSDDQVSIHLLEQDEQKEEVLEKELNLNQKRLEWVAKQLKIQNAKTIVDLGCGEGSLIQLLLKDHFFEKITGCDVSMRVLEIAKERLKIDCLPDMQQNRIKLLQTALTYQDKRIQGYDAATLIEVIEHLDLPRLDSLSNVVFGFAKPKIVIITTPNEEYNTLFKNLPKGQFRHNDHRFEWTRAEFQAWASDIANKFGYLVTFDNIGEQHESLGSPTQAGVFKRND